MNNPFSKLIWQKDCPDGRMNKDKFIELYCHLYPNGKADRFCKQVFKVFDQDNNGFVDFSEFLMVISSTTMGDLRKKLNMAFKIYDIDQNGLVDQNEMEKIITAIYELMGKEDEHNSYSSSSLEASTEIVKQIISKLDKNNDKSLSRDEFIEGCLADPDIRNLLVPIS